VDWRWHHLHDPGRYHWVWMGDGYALVDDDGIIIEYGG
jgi:Ni/Co efflux regulator RcnB